MRSSHWDRQLLVSQNGLVLTAIVFKWSFFLAAIYYFSLVLGCGGWSGGW